MGWKEYSPGRHKLVEESDDSVAIKNWFKKDSDMPDREARKVGEICETIFLGLPNDSDDPWVYDPSALHGCIRRSAYLLKNMNQPNVKALVIHRMAMLMIPEGCGDGKGAAFLRGAEELTKPGNISARAKQATEWVNLAIRAVREAAEPNPWKKSTDEEIATELVKQIKARKEAKSL